MLYVVSGFMRTGTSMMMRALEAGGLLAIYAKSREDMRRRYADDNYDPNEGGLYELEQEAYRKDDFPREYDGRLIKCLNTGVQQMAVMSGGIRVIFMRRDAEEVRQSYDAFFGQQLRFDPETFQHRMDLICERIANRRDVVSLTQLWYRDVVNDPAGTFWSLASSGWPIDPLKAIAVVKPELCRYRLEELEVGIV